MSSLLDKSELRLTELHLDAMRELKRDGMGRGALSLLERARSLAMQSKRFPLLLFLPRPLNNNKTTL